MKYLIIVILACSVSVFAKDKKNDQHKHHKTKAHDHKDSTVEKTKVTKEKVIIKVKGMVAIFTYGFKVALENFEEEKVELTTISDYDTRIQQAVAREYVPEEDQFTLQKWRMNPSEWNG